MFFLTPKYLKEGRHIARGAAKLLRYRRDLLAPEEMAPLERAIAELRAALAARSREGVARASREVERLFAKRFPAPSDAGWRENCEVFLVAIVIALGVRSYFLQPFTIPTGSMQPTLNGVIGHPSEAAAPNFLVRAVQQVVMGRNYVEVVAAADDRIATLREKRRFRFFTFTEIAGERGTKYTVRAPARVVAEHFRIRPGAAYRRGETILRGYVETGDHVFVDKLSYHFRMPRRGDVFVFRTTNIRGIEVTLNPAEGSQYYIKRLVGLPGDELRVDAPLLHVNGAPATEPGIRRVAAARDGYRGYSHGPATGGRFTYLSDPSETVKVPEKAYWAMGDNSFYSSDSRAWGAVPEPNIVGRGVWVYWPFWKHWGPFR